MMVEQLAFYTALWDLLETTDHAPQGLRRRIAVKLLELLELIALETIASPRVCGAEEKVERVLAQFEEVRQQMNAPDGLAAFSRWWATMQCTVVSEVADLMGEGRA